MISNSLSISLTESVLFLRSPDVSTHRSPTLETAPPSILRGLLILTLVRPTRVSSIQVDLACQSRTTWTEGHSTRHPSEFHERATLYSTTRTFFQAPRVPTVRRALSLEPGLSYYADEADSVYQRRSSSSSRTRDPDHTRQFYSVDTPRGRERARGRLGEDNYLMQRAPPLEAHSPSPLDFGSPSPPPSEDGAVNSPLYTSSRSTSSRRSLTIPPLSVIDSLSVNRPSSHSAMHLPLRARSTLHSQQHHDSSPSSVGRRDSNDNSLERPRSLSRGRMSARFSLAGSILEAMRNFRGSPAECGHSRQGGETRDEDHSHPPPIPHTHVREAVTSDSKEQGLENSGDGWQEFKKGTYTFPISFAIPPHVPPTIQCDYGSVTWSIKATVHRPGTFTPKLSASREVILVASPCEDNREDTNNVHIERFWEDQMQYLLSVSGRVFPIGGAVPLTLSFLPMAKVKIFKILVQLEERVEYFFAFSPKARRRDPERCFTLLSLQSRDENTPLLPLPQVVTPATESMLHSLLKSQDNLSESMASLMGPGPWTLHMALTVPSAFGTLHPSNKNKRAPIEISHTLKVVVRVQRGDEQNIDPLTGEPKQFDIVLRAHVHVLSPLSNAQRTALPCYSESLDAPSILAPPYVSLGNRNDPLHHPRHSAPVESQGVFRLFALPEERSSEVDALFERNMMFERLITGQQSEDGVLPPAYCAVSRPC